MRLLKRFILFNILVIIVGCIGLYGYAYFSPKLDIRNANQFYIYDDTNELIYQGSGNNEWISLAEVSPYFVDAIISTEDKNFYKHFGFDFMRIGKANVNLHPFLINQSTVLPEFWITFVNKPLLIFFTLFCFGGFVRASTAGIYVNDNKAQINTPKEIVIPNSLNILILQISCAKKPDTVVIMAKTIVFVIFA